MGNRFFSLWLILLLTAVAFVLRVWGANFGLPAYVYHPDESAIVERAAAILRTGDFNPDWFNYPSGYIYIQALAQIAYFLLGAVRGNFAFVPQETLPQFYLVGRLTTAVFGTGIVLVLYQIGKKAHSTHVGLIAAALAAFSYLNTVHSHYVTTDVPSSLWVALCTLFCVLILQRGQMLWYVLAGLMAGFAAGTKYNAGLVILLIPIVHILRVKWGEWGWIDRRLCFGILAVMVGFLFSTPYALLDLPAFLNGIGFELYHYNTQQLQPGYTGQSGLWYLHAIFASVDMPLAIVYSAGLIYTLMRPTRLRVLLLAMPVLYFIGLARTPVHFERNLLPMTPALSVMGAIFINDTSNWIAGCLQQRWLRLVLSAVATGAVVWLPLFTSICFDWSITRLDVRTEAGNWIAQNIPEGAKIAVEHYSVPFPRDRYQVFDVLRLWDHSAEWYAEQSFDYIIVSNGVWLTLLDQSDRYRQELDVFHNVQMRYLLVKEFTPTGVPPLVTAGYSTIREYHFPSVWIFRVK